MAWDPQQYLKFGGERLRPALDLLARVPTAAPATVVDLGCGPGTVTAMLRQRWPQARITGVDNATVMLDQARAKLPDVEFECADLATWAPVAPVDVIYSNAALHWLDDHATLFPRLLRHLSPGGVLAVQMPAQHTAPSHTLGFALAGSPRFAGTLAPLVRKRPILDPDAYDALLAPEARTLDLWFTEYLQRLSGANPVAEFTKGSFVGVWLAALPPTESAAFEAEYRARILAAYPPRADGITLFPFRRFFLVATR